MYSINSPIIKQIGKNRSKISELTLKKIYKDTKTPKNAKILKVIDLCSLIMFIS